MDNTIRTKRLEILRRMRKLEVGRCEDCSGSSSTGDVVNCSCKAAVAIRECGDELINLTRKHRQKRIQALFKQARESGLTMELYRFFREQGITNKQLWKAIGMKEADYYDWKYEQGLITERRKVQKEVPVNRKKHGITEEQFKQAAAKGIPRDMVRQRRKKGWSVERALTEPPNARKAEFAVWKKLAASNGVSSTAFKNRISRGETFEEAATRPPNVRRKQVAR